MNKKLANRDRANRELGSLYLLRDLFHIHFHYIGNETTTRISCKVNKLIDKLIKESVKEYRRKYEPKPIIQRDNIDATISEVNRIFKGHMETKDGILTLKNFADIVSRLGIKSFTVVDMYIRDLLSCYHKEGQYYLPRIPTILDLVHKHGLSVNEEYSTKTQYCVNCSLCIYRLITQLNENKKIKFFSTEDMYYDFIKGYNDMSHIDRINMEYFDEYTKSNC